MNHKKFKELRIGDKVILSRPLRNYYGGGVWDNIPEWIKAETEGRVSTEHMPAVTGRERDFVCVEFPNMKIKYKTFSGKSDYIVPKVGAFREDLK